MDAHKTGFWYSLFLKFMGYKQVPYLMHNNRLLANKKANIPMFEPIVDVAEWFPVGTMIYCFATKYGERYNGPLVVVDHRRPYIVKGNDPKKIHQNKYGDHWVHFYDCVPLKYIWINPIDYKLLYGKEKRKELYGKNRSPIESTG